MVIVVLGSYFALFVLLRAPADVNDGDRSWSDDSGSNAVIVNGCSFDSNGDFMDIDSSWLLMEGPAARVPFKPI